MSATTLFDKIWSAHEVAPGLIYIDLHLVHEVTSPQAFDGLRLAGRTVRRPDRTLATADHNVPTDGTPVAARIRDELSRVQVETLERNAAEFGIPIYSIGSARQGIVHIIGPELGVTQPGMTIVCGDSHTATHGAFGALAFGIGTSEVEHVLATQTLAQPKPRSMRIRYEGALGQGVTAKDLILGTIGQMGTDGAAGHVVEYAGPAIEALSMEGRMTVCNMTIEGGGRAGMIAPDDTTFAWLDGRVAAPADLEAAVEQWRGLRTDDGAAFDREIVVDAAALSPLVTWGTNPAQVVGVGDRVPDPASDTDERALRYMALEPGTPMQDVRLDRVFIGSCTNARIGDLRAAARVVEGRTVAPDVRAMVVPGSEQVRAQAEAEGLDRVFTAAGFDWRTAGCSMCLGMNPDILAPGERCASTSNRNFEGRQGRGGRTHLVSPEMAAAAAIEGHFVDIRQYDGWTPSVRGSGRPAEVTLGARDRDLRRRQRARPRRRRHGPDHPQAVPQARRADRLRRSSCSTTGRRSPAGTCPRTRSSPPGRTSAAAPAASTRRGRCRTTASARSCRRASPTSSSPTARRSGCSRSCCRTADVRALMAAGEAEVDLEALEVRFDGRAVPFALDAERRRRLLEGLDDIALTLQQDDAIARFEAEREREGPVTTASVALSAQCEYGRAVWPAGSRPRRRTPWCTACCGTPPAASGTA